MKTLLLLAMVAQPQPSQADVAGMVDAILEAAVARETKIEGEFVGDRPIYVDTAATTAAFREFLIPELEMRLADASIEREFIASGEEDVIRCAPRERGTPPDCSIPGNGILVSVRSARSTATAGVYMLMVRVRWISEMSRGGFPSGYDMQMFVAKVQPSADEPAAWKVVRKGIAIVRQNE